jgi:hypothetical protein
VSKNHNVTLIPKQDHPSIVHAQDLKHLEAGASDLKGAISWQFVSGKKQARKELKGLSHEIFGPVY